MSKEKKCESLGNIVILLLTFTAGFLFCSRFDFYKLAKEPEIRGLIEQADIAHRVGFDYAVNMVNEATSKLGYQIQADYNQVDFERYVQQKFNPKGY